MRTKQKEKIQLNIKYVPYTLMELREINYLKRRGLDIPERLLNKKNEDLENEDEEKMNKEEINKLNDENEIIKLQVAEEESSGEKEKDVNVIKFRNLNIDKERNKLDPNSSLIKIDLTNNSNQFPSPKKSVNASNNNIVTSFNANNLKMQTPIRHPINK